MERPAGVTFLAVLSIAFGTAVGLLGVLALGWGALISRGGFDSWGLNKFFAIGGAIIAAICFAVTALYAAIGRGLLKLQNWARIVSIVFAALGLLSSPLTLMDLAGPMHPLLTLRFVAGAVIDIWVLVYLFRPHVKQAFEAGGL
jgi:hypothetical protein